MIYLDNTHGYSQRIFIPRNDESSGATGHTITLQSKDYTINENGVTRIHPDAGYDGISGGSISVYVSAATGVTFEHLNVEENGVYVPTGDTAYSGVTVNVEDGGYDEGYHDGFEAGYSSGYTEGYSSGSTDGFASGYTSGMTDGYASGYTSGSTDGYASGMTDGYSSGYTEGFEAGYSSGRTDGIEYQKSLLTDYTATTNGVYTSETGYSGVTVDVDMTPAYNSGYTSGYTDGYATGSTEGYASGVTDGQEAQKALLTSATFTQNGIYTRENGWDSVDVDLPLGNTTITIEDNTTTELEPPAGFEGFKKVTIITNVTGSTPAVLTGLTATTNNTSYLPPQGYNGFNRVDVNIDPTPYYDSGYTEGYASGSTEGFASGYTSGVTDGLASGYTSGYTEGYSSGSTDGFSSGVTYQKSQMVSTTIRANGNYTREDGWNSIIVDVPFTQILTQAQYDALSYKDPRIIYLING